MAIGEIIICKEYIDRAVYKINCVIDIA